MRPKIETRQAAAAARLVDAEPAVSMADANSERDIGGTCACTEPRAANTSEQAFSVEHFLLVSGSPSPPDQEAARGPRAARPRPRSISRRPGAASLAPLVSAAPLTTAVATHRSRRVRVRLTYSIRLYTAVSLWQSPPHLRDDTEIAMKYIPMTSGVTGQSVTLMTV